MLIVPNVISRINWALKKYFTSSHMGTNLCHHRKHYCLVQRGRDNWLHRDILMFSFIPLMKREYAYYIKTEIMLTIHRSYFTNSNLSPPVASLLWQTTSSCTSPSPNIRLFHTSTLLFMLFTLRKVSSFSFWIFISFW